MAHGPESPTYIGGACVSRGPGPRALAARWRSTRAASKGRAIYEARPRPWVDAARRMARRDPHLFTPADRFQLLAREAALRLAALPFPAAFGSGC